MFAGLEWLTGDALLDAIHLGNPTLAARRAGVRAARERVPQASALDDPTLSYQIAPWSVGRGHEPGHIATLSQAVPWPGKRAARGGAAQANLDAEEADLLEEERHHLLESRMLFAEYWLADRQIVIARTSLALVRQLRATAISAVASGAASTDAYEAAMGEAEAERVLLRAQREREVKAAEINAIVGRPAEAAVPPPTVVLTKVFPMPDQGLLLRLAQRRPAVAAARARVRQEEERLTLARRNAFPDVTVSVGYTSMDERHQEDVFVGASINVPLNQERRHAAVAEMGAELDAARERLRGAELDAAREAMDALARLREGASAIALLRDLALPNAHQSAEATSAALAAGTGQVGAALRAQRAVFAAESQLAEEEHEFYHQLGNLECCIGVPVESLSVPVIDTLPEREPKPEPAAEPHGVQP